jgi:hypothetical protein
VLEIGDAGGSACEHVRTLIDDHLAAVDQRIAELTEARHVLQGLARRAAAQDPADCQGYCKILSK